MAWIWVSLVYEIVFAVLGLVFMFLPGKIVKFFAIPIFIFILPIAASKDVIWNISDSASATYINLVLPLPITAGRWAVHVILVFSGLWNWFDEINRDLIGRDKATKKFFRRKNK